MTDTTIVALFADLAEGQCQLATMRLVEKATLVTCCVPTFGGGKPQRITSAPSRWRRQRSNQVDQPPDASFREKYEPN